MLSSMKTEDPFSKTDLVTFNCCKICWGQLYDLSQQERDTGGCSRVHHLTAPLMPKSSCSTSFKIESSVEALQSSGLPIPRIWMLCIFISGENFKGKSVVSIRRTSTAWLNGSKTSQHATATTRQPSGEWRRTFWSQKVSALIAGTSSPCWNRSSGLFYVSCK